LGYIFLTQRPKDVRIITFPPECAKVSAWAYTDCPKDLMGSIMEQNLSFKERESLLEKNCRKIELERKPVLNLGYPPHRLDI